MNATIPKQKRCWERPRLIASWFVWLAALLLVLQPSGGIVGIILIVAAGLLRPRPLRVWSERHLLKAAIALLVVLPLTAVLLGSQPAMIFMRTSTGTVLIVAIWVVDTALDFPNYRRLRPLR